jgi:hypothetical protein
MGVRFVDVEATVLYRIEQLVSSHERKKGGTPEGQAAPITAAAPTRERTVLGVGWPQAKPEHRPELPAERAAMPSAPEAPPEEGWDAPRPSVTTQSKVEVSKPPREASVAAADFPGRRRRLWPVVLLVLVAAGCAAYFMRERIPWLRALIEGGSSGDVR